MYDIDFIDRDIVKDCIKQFVSVYDLTPVIIGATNDATCVIAKCNFPDGVFYFRVNEKAVSEAFATLKEADDGRHCTR